VERQKEFRKTVGSPTNRGMYLEMNLKSNYESVTQPKFSHYFTTMKDSIINQWLKTSQIQSNYASEKVQGERR
jgi:hypothetical protein